MSEANGVVGHSVARFTGEFGTFDLHGFEFDDGLEHAALVAITPTDGSTPLVRLQSACLTGTAFHAVMCDCRQQLESSLAIVAEQGGTLVYLDQEGRGHGLVEKVSQLDAIARGANTYEAAVDRGVVPDVRDYAQAAIIVHAIYGPVPIRLLTNNPEKIARVEAAGIVVDTRVPIEPEPTLTNTDYLRVKKALMGHLLTKV